MRRQGIVDDIYIGLHSLLAIVVAVAAHQLLYKLFDYEFDTIE